MSSSINVNIGVNFGGLPAIDKEQRNNMRFVKLEKDGKSLVYRTSSEGRSQVRAQQGEDPSGKLKTPAPLTSPRKDEPAAFRMIVSPVWGMAWIYRSKVDWDVKTTDTLYPNYFELISKKINIQVISGDRTKKVNILVSATNASVVDDILLPVANDKFIYTAIIRDENDQLFTRSILTGFSIAREISTPAGFEFTDIQYSYLPGLGSVGFNVAYPFCPYPNNFRPSCDYNYAVNDGSFASAYYGFMLASPATIMGDSFTYYYTPYSQGMRTPPILLSALPGDAWTSASCMDEEKFDTYSSDDLPIELTLDFPSVYSLFEQGTSLEFGIQYASNTSWKTEYYAPYWQYYSFVDSDSPRSSISIKFAGTEDFSNFIEPILGIKTGFMYAAYDPTSVNPDFITKSLCVAVIDETSPSAEQQTIDWIAFRSNWPDRPFSILQPYNPSYSEGVNLPAGYDGTFSIVSRDNGSQALISDWYAILGLDDYPRPMLVSLFIDESGSMSTATVSASLEYFTQRCAENGVYIISSYYTASELYIKPFVNDAIPGIRGFFPYDLNKGKIYCALSNPWGQNWTSSLINLGFIESELS